MKSNAETEYNEGAWVLLSLVLFPVVMLLDMWALCAIWALTITQELGVAPLNAVGAIGLLTLAQYATTRSHAAKSREVDIRRMIVTNLVRPPLAVLIVKFSIWLVAFVGWPS